jgi:D-arginine dehydrogenase
MFIATHEQGAALERSLADYREMVPTVRAAAAGEALDLCPMLDAEVIAGGIIEPLAADLDVHALHTAFLRGTRQRGGRILTSAGVTALSRAGNRWAVTTATGTDHFDAVVNAAGAWCDRVGALAGARPLGLVPKRRTAFTFTPPTGPGPYPWPMVIDVDEQFYFRPEGVHVLASPCDETPVEPQDIRHDEIDVARGIERVESVTTLQIRSVVRAWAGLRSFVPDDRPVNGWDPELPGFYWLAGQGGFGIKTSPAMSRFAAAMILEGAPPADLEARGITAASVGAERLRGTVG